MEENGKPKKKTWHLFDYIECNLFIENKYEINTRDYAGKFTSSEQTSGVSSAPYQDFWHFVLDKAPISNGCIMTMCEWWFDGAEVWQREIGMMFLDEFGEGENGDRSIEFYVWW